MTPRTHGQRGNVTVLITAVVVVAGLLCLAVGHLAGAASTQARADTAADAAALAAASDLARGMAAGDAREAASRAARANGAVVTRSAIGPGWAEIEVRLATSSARARAEVSSSRTTRIVK